MSVIKDVFQLRRPLFFILLFLAAYTSIFFIHRLFPFIDLPFHLSASTIYKFYEDSNFDFNRYFELNTFLVPNTFYIYFTNLPVFNSIEQGNAIFYQLYCIFFVTIISLIIKILKGNLWFVLLSFPFILNYSATFGFVGFTLSIPVVLFFFYSLLLYKKTGNRWCVLLLLITLLITFFVHALSVLFLIFIFTMSVFLKRRRLTDFKRPLLIIVPTVAALSYWWYNFNYSASLPGFLFDYYLNDYVRSIPVRINLLYLDNYFLLEDGGRILGLIWTLPIFVLLGFFFFNMLKKKESPVRNRYTRHLYVFLIASFFCFFFLPDQLPEIITPLFGRFSVFLLIGIIFFLSYNYGKVQPVLKVIFIALAMIHFSLTFNYFDEFNRENEFFDESFFPDQTKEELMGSMIFDYNYRGREVYLHFQEYHIVWKQGIVNTVLTGFVHNPVRSNPEGPLLLVPNLWISRNGNFDSGVKKLDYILIRGEIPETERNDFRKFGTYSESGKWKILEKN